MIYRYEQGPNREPVLRTLEKTHPNPLPVEEGETMLRDLERQSVSDFVLAREQIFRTLTSCRN
jgi:hypothetical protein